jgi:hypothetical protein
MQTSKIMWKFLLAASVAAGLAGGTVKAQLLTFDNSSSIVTSVGFPTYGSYGLDNPGTPQVPNVRFDYGSPNSGTPSWSSQDAGGNPASGSVELSMVLAGSGSAGFTFDLFNNAQNFSNLSFDVMVDPSSTPEAAGVAAGYGYFQVATRDGSYTFNGISAIGEDIGAAYTGYTAGEWQHFSVALTGANQSIRALTFQDYGGPGQNVNGPVILYIDNIDLTPVPEPSSIALIGLGGALLLGVVRRRQTTRS